MDLQAHAKFRQFGATRMIDYKNRLLESCKDMIALDPSGSFHYFWLEKGSCLSANDLRVIADELDKRNAGFEELFFNKVQELPEQTEWPG